MKKRFVLYLIIVVSAVIFTFLPIKGRRPDPAQNARTVNGIEKEGGTEYGVQ